jgi:hypothetical protein
MLLRGDELRLSNLIIRVNDLFIIIKYFYHIDIYMIIIDQYHLNIANILL